MVGRWRVDVDDSCIGSGSCTAIAPDVFTLGADHRSHPAAVPVPSQESIVDAAASCPVEAITIRDLDTGEPVIP